MEGNETLTLSVQPVEPLAISTSSNNVSTITIVDDESENTIVYTANLIIIILLSYFITVATVFFEQVSYTVPVEDTNITLRILVNGTLATSITLSIDVSGPMAMSIMNSGWSDIILKQ